LQVDAQTTAFELDFAVLDVVPQTALELGAVVAVAEQQLQTDGVAKHVHDYDCKRERSHLPHLCTLQQVQSAGFH
jgi:hypothetical protein